MGIREGAANFMRAAGLVAALKGGVAANPTEARGTAGTNKSAKIEGGKNLPPPPEIRIEDEHVMIKNTHEQPINYTFTREEIEGTIPKLPKEPRSLKARSLAETDEFGAKIQGIKMPKEQPKE